MRYKLTLIRKNGKRQDTEDWYEAGSIEGAINEVTESNEFENTLGRFRCDLKISKDRKTATIMTRIGGVEISEIKERKFRVDTSDMPSASRGNPIIDSYGESLDQVLSITMSAAMQAGFLYNQLTIKKSDDGRSGTLHESMHGSMMRVFELNEYNVDLVRNGRRQAGVGPFWGINVREVIGILGNDDPAKEEGVGIWWEIDDDDNAVMKHEHSDIDGLSIKITRVK